MEASKKTSAFPIYLVTSKSQHKLAMTFVRFQEYFESPEFVGRVFTLEEFADWYAAQHDDFFSYSDDWGGFNIPSWVVTTFRAGIFDPLSKKEEHFLKLIEGADNPAYFIGMNVSRRMKIGILRHEMVHALAYLQPNFDRDTFDYLHTSRGTKSFASARDELFNKLQAMGYGKNVLVSEAVAYLITGLTREFAGLDLRFIESARRELRSIFEKHFGFSIHRADATSILDRIHVIDLDGTV